jgi:glycosyltransferase involved in cell wall biosynthesis
MRIAVLWTGLSGYLNACLKELAARDGIELFVAYQHPVDDAPFDERQFTWIPDRLPWRTEQDLISLSSRLNAFQPEILVMPSWHVSPYRRAARNFERRCWRVMIMDNPWRGSLRQRFGTLASSFYVKPIADVVWLPGERQATFARKLGFPQSAILRGSFSCDVPAFAAVHSQRLQSGAPLPRSFIFVGRFVKTKGIDKLVKAYSIYRSRVAQPWPLICCGSGSLRWQLQNQEGIRLDGFVQPDDMPRALSSAGCLILPSRFEPWALVVHEAAAAGRLILASENVGAVTHLVQPGYNGFIFNSNEVNELAILMCRVSTMSDSRLDQMSIASSLLSKQFSPTHWVNTLLDSYQGRAAR